MRISGGETITRALYQMRLVDAALAGIGEDTALAYLEDLQARLRPATPVRTGRMKANYYVEAWGDGRLELQDRMDYAGYVAFGTRRQRANPALHTLLTGADDELTALLDARIASRLAAITA